MRAGEIAMQDADQVDERVLPARETLENAARVDVGFDDVDRGKQDQVLGALAVPRGDGDADAAPRELRNQMPADKA